MRSSGFEPPRYRYRHPLKLMRLPVPPRPHREIDKNDSVEVRPICEVPGSSAQESAQGEQSGFEGCAGLANAVDAVYVSLIGHP